MPKNVIAIKEYRLKALQDTGGTEMNEIIKINKDGSDRPTVLGRELHKALEIKTPYKKWFDRMTEYGFAENSDFVTMVKNVRRADGTEMPQGEHDHQLTLDMAKELCMIQRSEIGRKCRQYFIEVEKQWNSPEAVMDRALKYADQKIKLLEQERANAFISIQQLSDLKDEIYIKAIDLCNSGREYIKGVGVEVRIAISDKICEVMEVTELEQLRNYQYESAVKICRTFKNHRRYKSPCKNIPRR